MSDINQLLQFGSVAILGYIGLQLVQIYNSEIPEPEPENNVKRYHRWTSNTEASFYHNGAKQPIRNVEKVGPNAFVITHLNGSKSTINTQDINRYINDRFYMANQFSHEELHPAWTHRLNIH